MWIYDYKTKREYFASSPRKPAQVLEQLDIFLYLTSGQDLQF